MAWGCGARAAAPIRAGKLAGCLPAGDGKQTTHQRQQNYVKGRALAAIPALCKSSDCLSRSRQLPGAHRTDPDGR
jgi:hypothetical protein